jgi:hypothetical protein
MMPGHMSLPNTPSPDYARTLLWSALAAPGFVDPTISILNGVFKPASGRNRRISSPGTTMAQPRYAFVHNPG